MNRLPTGNISQTELYTADELTPRCEAAMHVAREALAGTRAENKKLARRIFNQRTFIRRLRTETDEIKDAAQRETERFKWRAEHAETTLKNMREEYARMETEYRTATTRLTFVDEDRARLSAELEKRKKDHILPHEAELLQGQVRAATAARARLATEIEKEREGWRRRLAEETKRADLNYQALRQLTDKVRSMRFSYSIVENGYTGSNTWLYYCGCTHRGQAHPEVCPYHYSPRTQEGMIDGF
jgi:chromosome segregation ATPase